MFSFLFFKKTSIQLVYFFGWYAFIQALSAFSFILPSWFIQSSVKKKIMLKNS